jgi:hypothetical protein
MESLHSALAQIFACRIQVGNAQWYCIDVDAQHVDGLSKLLNITPEAYHLLAVEIGWVKPNPLKDGMESPTRCSARRLTSSSTLYPCPLR